jgi:NADPH:quinone reductase-like Zn-dependent oxidoreductase
MVGAPNDIKLADILLRMIGALVLSRVVSQKPVPFLARSNHDDLSIVADLMASGKVTPVIDRCYKLIDAPDAFRYMEEGHAQGKVVITV